MTNSKYDPADYPDGKGPRPPDADVDPLEDVISTAKEMASKIDEAAEVFALLEIPVKGLHR